MASRSRFINAWMNEPYECGARSSGCFSLLRCGTNCSPERDWNIGRGAGLRKRQAAAIVVALLLLNACSESMFENAGSRNSLLEDRKACAVEINNSPAATAYRQNPTAHPDFVRHVFEDMNRCIEGKG
jgi:hypothetical protein